MDREMRDWLRGLAERVAAHATLDESHELSNDGSEYLARVVTDGTLKAVFAEFATSGPELAG